MKKTLSVCILIVFSIINIKAQDYLMLLEKKGNPGDYSLLLLTKIDTQHINELNKIITLNNKDYLYLPLKITNEKHELFSCCEDDTTSYSGMDQYEKNLKKFGDKRFELLANKYKNLIDSIKFINKRSLRIRLTSEIVQIFSVKIEICSCVYGTVKNSQRIYYNMKYLKKILVINRLSSHERKEFKDNIKTIIKLAEGF